MSRGGSKLLFWYLILVLSVVFLAFVGYTGFLLYPRFSLPDVAGIGLMVLAAAAGIASFFSPCSFPILVTLLARETSSTTEEPLQAPLRQALVFAAALSLGATLFLLLAGIIVALGGASLFANVTFTNLTGRVLRIIVGMVLIIFGLIQVGVIPTPFGEVWRIIQPLTRAQARLRRQRPTFGFALFGFGYILAGFG